jgi:hypothetical protein
MSYHSGGAVFSISSISSEQSIQSGDPQAYFAAAHQGPALVHCSAQHEPVFATEATAFVHFSAQPEPLLVTDITQLAY